MVQVLKKMLKGVLVKRQQIIYQKEYLEKKVTYQSWVEAREKQLETEISLKLEEAAVGEEISGMLKAVLYTAKTGEEKVFLLIPYTVCVAGQIERLIDIEADYAVFYRTGGRISPLFYGIAHDFFMHNREVLLAYTDEDVEDMQGDKQGYKLRKDPWLKPDWSPDTFLSMFYFGSLFVIRKVTFNICMKSDIINHLKNQKYQDILYHMCHSAAKRSGGFEVRKKENELEAFPIGHISEVLYHGESRFDLNEWKLTGESEAFYEQGTSHEKEDIQEPEVVQNQQDMISIIIPSKDNPDVLRVCLESILNNTTVSMDKTMEYHNEKQNIQYEIIIIDNGSSKENRRKIEGTIERLNGSNRNSNERLNRNNNGNSNEILNENNNENNESRRVIKYFYEKQEFNFSKMCNMGALKASGELLLFFNDDMEAVNPDWLMAMAGKAKLSYVGAVGIKLLYPEGTTIQHAGVTNLRMGPAHKLQYLDDEQIHYFGKNRYIHNMLAVTGACLMVKKEIFMKLGKFDESLAVAFNDVELCYRIYEAGYYNVVINDYYLYHHESLSRGKDEEAEKQKRLLDERDRLYELHPALYAKDPFYHPQLTKDILDVNYRHISRYEGTLNIPWGKVEECSVEDYQPQSEKNIQSGKWCEDACVKVGIENAMSAHQWKYGVKVSPEQRQEQGYYVQGYAFVVNANNACYEKSILLQGEDKIYKITAENQYRPDILENLNNQMNVELTGFAVRIKEGQVSPGRYRIGIGVRDLCSRQKLYNFSNWYLEVERA